MYTFFLLLGVIVSSILLSDDVEEKIKEKVNSTMFVYYLSPDNHVLELFSLSGQSLQISYLVFFFIFPALLVNLFCLLYFPFYLFTPFILFLASYLPPILSYSHYSLLDFHPFIPFPSNSSFHFLFSLFLFFLYLSFPFLSLLTALLLLYFFFLFPSSHSSLILSSQPLSIPPFAQFSLFLLLPLSLPASLSPSITYFLCFYVHSLLHPYIPCPVLSFLCMCIIPSFF